LRFLSDFAARLDDGVVRGTAEVASVLVKDANLEAHLQSPDFFDAERFPQLSFEAQKISRSGDALTIAGELTLKGHTEPVEITGHINDPAPDPYGGERFGLHDEDDDAGDGPSGVARFRRAIAGADALLFATPEYNSSVPGVLKNAVDWASRPPATSPLRNKPVAVIGASTGMFGAVWAQAELRKVLGATGARVAEVQLAVGHAHEHLDPAGRPADPAQDEALRESVRVLLGELENREAAVQCERRPQILRRSVVSSNGRAVRGSTSAPARTGRVMLRP
jgi:chromate reductase